MIKVSVNVHGTSNSNLCVCVVVFLFYVFEWLMTNQAQHNDDMEILSLGADLVW